MGVVAMMNDSAFDPFLVFDNVDKQDETLSDEKTMFILQILLYGVTPFVAGIGICGNILSIMVLTRQGLDKCSNILLVSLACSDLCFLIAVNNVPIILYDMQGGGRFMYSYTVSYCLFILSQFLTILDYSMFFVGLTIPAFITVERFVAVFFPLHMPRIVTPVRTWAVVLFVVVYGISYMTYTCFWYRFDYSFDPTTNQSVGRMVTTSLFHQQEKFKAIMNELVLSVKIQPLVTLVGCILIIYKVKMASIRRNKMATTSKRASSSAVSKTTRTLLTVCVFYILICCIVEIPSWLPGNMILFRNTSGDLSNAGIILYQVMNLAVCVNGSWNFFIYVCLNKNFRDTFKEILGTCFHGTASHVK